MGELLTFIQWAGEKIRTKQKAATVIAWLNLLLFTHSIGQAKLPSSRSSDLNSNLPDILHLPNMFRDSQFAHLKMECSELVLKGYVVLLHLWRGPRVQLISVNTQQASNTLGTSSFWPHVLSAARCSASCSSPASAAWSPAMAT